MLSSALSNIPLSTSLVTPVLRMVFIRWKACAPLTVAASVAKRGLSHGDPERGPRWGQGAGLCPFFDSWPKPIFLHVSQALIKQGCSPTGARYFSSPYFFPRAPRMFPEVRERAAGCEESSVGVARPQDTSLLWPSSAFPQLTTPGIKVSSQSQCEQLLDLGF